LSIRSLYYPTLHLPSDFLLMHAWTNFSFSRCWLQFLKHLHMEKNHKFLTLFCVQAPNFSKKNAVFSQCTRPTSSPNCIYCKSSNMYRTKSDKCIVRYCIYSLGVAQAFAACSLKACCGRSWLGEIPLPPVELQLLVQNLLWNLRYHEHMKLS